MRVFDAICPLVTKVHMEVGQYQDEGRECILLGHAGHPEVEGTLGQYHKVDDKRGGMYLVESVEDVDRMEIAPDTRLAYLTRTTLSVDDANRIINRLVARFPDIVGPPKEDICYATQNRQEAVRVLSNESDLVLVLGSQNSSNSQRLKELSIENGIPSYLIDGADDINPDWFEDIQTVLITAGASAPESVVADCVRWLQDHYGATVEVKSLRDEEVSFPLPRGLRALAQ